MEDATQIEETKLYYIIERDRIDKKKYLSNLIEVTRQSLSTASICKIGYVEQIPASKNSKIFPSGYTITFGILNGKSNVSIFVQTPKDMKYFFDVFMRSGIKKEWKKSITLQHFAAISDCFDLTYASNAINLLKMKNQETSNPSWPLAYRVPLINGFIEIYEDSTYRMFEDEE